MTGFRNVPNIAPQLQSPVTQLNGDHRPVLNGIDDVHAADFTSGNVTLTLAQAQAGTVTCTGATAPRDLIWPHGYTGTRIIVNSSGQVITVKTDASGTTVAVANGATVDVLISGNDVAVKSGVSSLSVTAPITDSGTTTVPVVGISAATDIAAGSMSAADKAKLDAAASANTNSVLVLRDASGRAQFTDPSASQDAATKASVAAAIAAAIVGADTYKGTWNASTNTPTLVSSTGTQGWHYRVATAGTTALDGISDWAVGDWAYFDGTAWQKVDNTDQVTSVQGRQGAVVVTPTDLSLVIGTDVQAYDAKLAAIVALTWAANKIIYTSGASTAAIQDFTALAQALLACATQGDMQNAIGLILGTTVQAYDAELAALAGLVSAANKLPYFTGLGTAALADFTAAGRALVDDADAAAQRTTLGLAIGTNVQAWDADLDTWAGKTAPSGTVVGTTDTQTLSNKRVTRRRGTTTSSATPTINTDNVDRYDITAQAVAITSFTTNLSGTPNDGDMLLISITGTAARAIAWSDGVETSKFEASTVALPTTTVTTARLDVGFVWNSVTSKWRCVAVA